MWCGFAQIRREAVFTGKGGILRGLLPKAKQQKCPKDRRLVPGSCDLSPYILTHLEGNSGGRVGFWLGSENGQDIDAEWWWYGTQIDTNISASMCRGIICWYLLRFPGSLLDNTRCVRRGVENRSRSLRASFSQACFAFPPARKEILSCIYGSLLF